MQVTMVAAMTAAPIQAAAESAPSFGNRPASSRGEDESADCASQGEPETADDLIDTHRAGCFGRRGDLDH